MLKRVPMALLLCFSALGWIYAPSFQWMADRWFSGDSYFSHGFLIPLVSLAWVWNRRKILAAAPKTGHAGGWALLAGAVALQTVAFLLRIYFLSLFSFIAALGGVVWIAAGRHVFRQIAYPWFFLFLMVPLPLLAISQITLTMKFWVTAVAAKTLTWWGIEAVRQGSYIVMPHSYLLIGDPCSGLRSFLAFLALGFIFAYGPLSRLVKLAIIFAGVPLALLSNLLRVLGLSLVAEIYGNEAAGGKVHDASGVLAFLFALTVFLWLRRRLEESRAR